MTSSLRIRVVTEDDAVLLPDLLEELGYPSSPDEIGTRLRHISAFPSAKAWLAENDGTVVGLVTCHLFPSVHATAPVAWLTTLVVGRASRGRGIGRALVATAEEWAGANGAVRISLTSGKQRDDAHQFYTRLGYEQTGQRFSRTLGAGTRAP